MSGMRSHGPPPDTPGRFLSQEGVGVGTDGVRLYHLGGERFAAAQTYFDQHPTGPVIVYAEGPFEVKLPIACFATEEEGRAFQQERIAEDEANRVQTCAFPPPGQINLSNLWWPMVLP